MSLSSDSLIHITTKEYLLSILNCSGFRPNFSNESIILKHGQLPDTRFAMVCFCDIPFGLIQNHINSYGDEGGKVYGIGLKKSWGIKNGLNPVFYLQEESFVSEVLFKRFDSLTDDDDDNKKELAWDFLKLFGFIKTYEGNNPRFNNLKYRFYDEREWRWIPNESILNGEQPFVSNVNFQDDTDAYRNILNNIILKFEPSDIDYIIINDEDEKQDFITLLKRLYSSKVTSEEMNRVLTCITTGKNIKDS